MAMADSASSTFHTVGTQTQPFDLCLQFHMAQDIWHQLLAHVGLIEQVKCEAAEKISPELVWNQVRGLAEAMADTLQCAATDLAAVAIEKTRVQCPHILVRKLSFEDMEFDSAEAQALSQWEGALADGSLDLSAAAGTITRWGEALSQLEIQHELRIVGKDPLVHNDRDLLTSGLIQALSSLTSAISEKKMVYQAQLCELVGDCI